VNEASTIIQSAAHEDANIIFGAVMNEQMKDEVKITVIATGFKTENPQRRERALASATAPISSTRTPGAFVPATPTPPPSVTVTSVPMDRAAAVAAAQHNALSALPEMPPPLQDEDLDVPAFIRKRGEIQ
jgi:cell division protein FtsZ